MKIIFFLTAIFLLSYKHALSIYDPLSVENNKYGIHIIDENDLENAAALVNSSNGDWGYVTMVITEDDRNEEKWRKIFTSLEKFHLIPLIRLATNPIGNWWKMPTDGEILPWANFLNGLPWPVKNRYVILYNEPNHAKEFGNTLDPESYASLVKKFSNALKEKSEDFFILPAGLDASAPNGKDTMDEEVFLRRMFLAEPDLENYIDGWVSHSYPNPNFSGKPNSKGKGTLSTYIWEKELLKEIGNGKIMPVFITETGWVHRDGDLKNRNFYTADQVATNLLIASETVWTDPDIAAITPFLLNYQTYPFSHFSWMMPDGKSFYPQYQAYQSIPKIKGQPVLTMTISPALEPTKQVFGISDHTVTDNTYIEKIKHIVISIYSAIRI